MTKTQRYALCGLLGAISGVVLGAAGFDPGRSTAALILAMCGVEVVRPPRSTA
jgi:hypothetical protein